MPAPRRSEFLTLLAMLGVAGGLVASGSRLQDRVRHALLDAAAPAQRLVRQSFEALSSSFAEWRYAGDSREDVASLEESLDSARRRVRQLEVAVANAQEEAATLRLTGPSPWRGESGSPLLVTELVSATVLGAESADLCRSGKVFDAGTTGGVTESSLVLHDPRPLVDQGDAVGLAPGQSVFAGRCIVGRVARAGRWVSTVQPIHDSEFRSLARIIRGEGDEAVYGAEGLLEGTGDGTCRLRHVPTTEAVSEGDAVYSAGGDAAGPEPMLFGTVTEAKLPESGSHWEISVKPAVDWNRVKSVQVLRRKLNPERMLAN